VYLLKAKSDVFSYFQDFHMLIKINSLFILKHSDQIMTQNTCPKTWHIIYILIAYCIRLVVLVHHNKMESLNRKIMICLKKLVL
jgi:hypothetical protein